MSSLISSRSHPFIKQLRSLRERKFREQRGEFLVEGIQPVLHAVESRAEVRALVVAPALLTSPLAHVMIAREERTGVRVVSVTPEVFASFAERENPSGLAAVVGIQPRELAGLPVTPSSMFVALYEVGNPGNLGTILRTVDAVGGSGVILVGAATDPYHPTAVRASRGALFRLPLVRDAPMSELLDWCARRGVRLITTSDKAREDLWSSSLELPLVIVFGNEGEGLPPELVQRGAAVRIPMAGAVDSLNLAVAAGVILYEVVRRRTEDESGREGLHSKLHPRWKTDRSSGTLFETPPETKAKDEAEG